MSMLSFLTLGYYGGGYAMGGWSSYLLLVVPAMILSLIAQGVVKSAYRKYSEIYSRSGYSGVRAAETVLHYYGIYDVKIEQVSGKLTDHYDPKKNVIRLSEGVYSSTGIAAIGIACHEAGHAAQYAKSYMPIKLRNSILPVCRIGSYVGLPLAMLGAVLSFEPLIFVGLALYAAIMVFQLATLPVEFNASRRAIKVIGETGMLKDEAELNGAKKVLTAAAMTYVAALAVSLANLLRFIMMFTKRRR